MSQEEVMTAVRHEARQHIPLPLSEVTLDWQIVEGRFLNSNGSRLKILLVAVPNEVINQYQEIANLSRLELCAVEAEVFALSRSSIGNEKRTIGLIDIGAQSTTVSIIDRGVLKRSHSFDAAGNEFTLTVSQSFSIDELKAEELKKQYGLGQIPQFLEPVLPYGRDLRKVLLPLCDIIIAETEKLSQSFYREEVRAVEKFILAGGNALLPGLKEYFEEGLGREVEVVHPFSNIFCPPILEETLKKMGPSFSVAVGAALRGVE
jgi:type IV pilus assembly protein PilM